MYVLYKSQPNHTKRLTYKLNESKLNLYINFGWPTNQFVSNPQQNSEKYTSF